MFLLISIALHGAVLSYPFVPLRPRAQELVAVVVISYYEGNESGEKAAGGAKSEPGRAGGSRQASHAGIENVKRVGEAPPARSAQLALAGAEEEGEAQAREDRLFIVVPDIDESEPEQEPARDSQDAFAASSRLTDSTPRGIHVVSVVADHVEASANSLSQRADHGSFHAEVNSSQTDNDPVKPLGFAVGPAGEFRTGSERPGGRTESYAALPQGSGSGGAGSGLGGGGGGLGTGSRSGGGYGGDSGSKFVQVRYAHAPRPEYPEQARREGKEGRVMLRVLVDEQGRSTSAEVDQSSGSKTLDMAAIEAIKRWRFSPARYGNAPVESWVRIPIEFRLSDPKH